MGHKRELTAKTYSIGPFRLDPDSHVVTRLGVPVPLGPRAVAVLAAIVGRAPEPVLKETIIHEAWPGLVVEDNNLTVQIAAIRRTLAQIPGGDRWIETVARRGYRFVGPVTALRPGALDAQSLGNVPLALTSFVGRERELVELKSLLAKNRLLTLVGPGGIGKTRLAMQLGGEVRNEYPDGIWFADFVPLADPALVPNAVAQALNLQQGSAKAALEAIARHCKGRRLLLILDNCEHVLDASARLSHGILRFTPEPTVIATSREPLRTEGEQVYRLSSLSLPDPGSGLDSLRRSEAVQLFVDRAQHRMPEFALTADRAPTVAELCRRLDGIPLALELAAARLDSLSLEDINARLHDRFRLLTEGLRTADSRHRTLHTTLDWSFELLTEKQRTVLRRLGVFAGGFDPEAPLRLPRTDPATSSIQSSCFRSSSSAPWSCRARPPLAIVSSKRLVTTRWRSSQPVPRPTRPGAAMPNISASSSKSRSPTGFECPTPNGMPCISARSTTCVMRSTGRFGREATPPSGSRLPPARGRCGERSGCTKRAHSGSKSPSRRSIPERRPRIRRGCCSRWVCCWNGLPPPSRS